MNKDHKVLYSGMQATGNLTLGNYLGALKNWVGLADEYECYYGVMDLHSLTVRQDPPAFRAHARGALLSMLVLGLFSRGVGCMDICAMGSSGRRVPKLPQKHLRRIHSRRLRMSMRETFYFSCLYLLLNDIIVVGPLLTAEKGSCMKAYDSRQVSEHRHCSPKMFRSRRR